MMNGPLNPQVRKKVGSVLCPPEGGKVCQNFDFIKYKALYIPGRLVKIKRNRFHYVMWDNVQGCRFPKMIGRARQAGKLL